MKLNPLLFAFILSQFAAGTAHSSEQIEIVHGTQVTPKNWIAHTVVALVATNEDGQSLCTASVVAKDLVVTAAHCVTSPKPGQQSEMDLIFSSDIHHADASMIRKVDRVEVPSEWNPSESQNQDTSDIALVHFSGDLPAGYAPSDLLPFEQTLVRGESVELAGYGITDASANTGAGVLRKTDVTVLNPSYSASEVELDQSHGGGACHGDSGGPAYVMKNGHPYLFGITSRGGGNCDKDVIYTRIAAYQGWFTRAVAKIRTGK